MLLKSLQALVLVAALAAAACGQAPSAMETHPAGPPPEVVVFEGAVPCDVIIRVDADPAAGFHWPYLFVVPADVRQGGPLYVQPNNDGQAGAPFGTHEYWARLDVEQNNIRMSGPLRLAALTPIFPRPADEGDGNLYTHALSRAALLTDDEALARVDLQLLAMIDDARTKLAVGGVETSDDVLLFGFSAAGDFVTRFAVLHPHRVRAVGAGGLGGLPILPVSELGGAPADYPVGVADIEQVSGARFDAEAFRAIPMLLMHGGDDDNDSVPFRDSYTSEQERLVAGTVGMDVAARLPKVRSVYDAFGMSHFDYVLIEGVQHRVTEEMRTAWRDFFGAQLD